MESKRTIESIFQSLSRYLISGFIFFLFVIYLPIALYLDSNIASNIKDIVSNNIFVLLIPLGIGILIEMLRFYRLSSLILGISNSEMKDRIVESFNIKKNKHSNKQTISKLSSLIHDSFIRAYHPDIFIKIEDSRIKPNVLAMAFSSIFFEIVFFIIWLLYYLIIKPSEIGVLNCFENSQTLLIYCINLLIISAFYFGREQLKKSYEVTTEYTISLIDFAFLKSKTESIDLFFSTHCTDFLIKDNKTWKIKEEKYPFGFESFLTYQFPKIVNVNVFSGQCPCNCVHCPVGKIPAGNRISELRQNEIDLKLFKKIVNEIKDKSQESILRIHAVGEPTLWRNLDKAVLYAKKQNVKTWLFTCAITKNNKLLQTLCENVNIIEVSVNSTNKKDYLKTKGINKFELVQRNINFIYGYKKTHNLQTRIIVSRVQSNNKEIDDAFIKYWKESKIVDDSFVRTYHTYNGSIDTLGYNNNNLIKEPCLVHWARFNIDYTGKVVICFNELFRKKIQPEFIIGDIKKQSISEIWQGEALNNIRHAELTNDYTILNYKNDIPCKNCAYCQPLNNVRQTSEYQISAII